MRTRGLLVLLAVAAACDSGSSSRMTGAGGATSAGGATGAGGAVGSGGTTATGGASATGGTSAAGGTSATGGSTGTGGAAGAGGSTQAGGTSGTGGVTGTGGATGTGGTTTPRSDAGSDTGRLDGSAGGTAGGGSGGTGPGGAGGTISSGGTGPGGAGGTGGTLADAGPDARPDVPADTAREAGPESSGNDAVTSDGAPCPYNGHVTYALARNANPTAAEQQAYTLITEAMDKAVYYYNCYTNITKALNVSYNSGVATADGNINGSIRFGGTQYMEYVTAMHEISHTVGIGTASNWMNFLPVPDGGGTRIWTGANATTEVRAITGNATSVVNGDSQHFWPYGLNYESEWKSEADGLGHCRLVMALRKDMGM
jgi:hypothetical protein